jgi:hypothetical protein
VRSPECIKMCVYKQLLCEVPNGAGGFGHVKYVNAAALLINSAVRRKFDDLTSL